MSAYAALGYIDQTIYANEDSSPSVRWRNDEVLTMLAEVRAVLLAPETLDGVS